MLLFFTKFSKVAKGMRQYIFLLSTLLINVLILLCLLTPCPSLRPFHLTQQSKWTYKASRNYMQIKDKKLGMELHPTGSILPDCSYACGPCAPCRRVMVSFMTCSVESCPVIYRCVCRGRYFHVPSN